MVWAEKLSSGAEDMISICLHFPTYRNVCPKHEILKNEVPLENATPRRTITQQTSTRTRKETTTPTTNANTHRETPFFLSDSGEINESGQ